MEETEDDDGNIVNTETMPSDSNSVELLKQPYLLESSMSVAEWVKLQQIKVESFVRLQVGEKLQGEQEESWNWWNVMWADFSFWLCFLQNVIDASSARFPRFWVLKTP